MKGSDTDPGNNEKIAPSDHSNAEQPHTSNTPDSKSTNPTQTSHTGQLPPIIGSTGSSGIGAGHSRVSGVGKVKKEGVTVTPEPMSVSASIGDAAVKAETNPNKASSAGLYNLKANVHSNTKAEDTLSSTATVSATMDAYLVTASDVATHSSLNDSAAGVDVIGMAPLATALSKMICHKETQTPLAIGLFGPWGSGKTNLMKLIREEIKNRPNKKTGGTGKVAQVWFNAWKYESQNDLWIALLQAITNQLESSLSMGEKYKKRFLKLHNTKFYLSATLITLMIITFVFLFVGILPDAALQEGAAESGVSPYSASDYVLALIGSILPAGAVTAVALSFGLLSPFIDFVKKIKKPLGVDVGELINGKNLPERIESFMTFEKELEGCITEYIDDNGRLLIFIDDLDRCSPDHAIEVIEAVNLFLDTKRCIFILGMDDELVSRNIALKYKEVSEHYSNSYRSPGSTVFSEEEISDMEEWESYGKNFLEKIIQIPIKVPPITQDEKKKYVSSLLDENQDSSTTQDATEQSSVPRSSKTQDENIEEKIISLSDEAKDLVMTLAPFLGDTPRSIKRFYNMLRFLRFYYTLNQDNFSEVNDVALTMWFFLMYKFPNEINEISNDGDQVTWAELSGGCDGRCTEIANFLSSFSPETKHAAAIMGSLNGHAISYYLLARVIKLH